MLRNFRKPLVVMSPKMLLRYPACVSHLSDLAPGTHFQPVLPDVKVADPKVVTRVLFVCGKHYYALDKEREAQNAKHMAIVRLEEICPFPAARLQEEVKKYANATEWIWAQEEQRNR
jgi:probable 2-oxoglutarate dehydrogenase E1 component DHKTD1